jgi:hypothetical protein
MRTVIPAAIASPAAGGALGVPVGSRVESIEIVYDEGTDNPISVPSPDLGGIGLAVIDNININGRFIREGAGTAEPKGERGRGHR